MSEAATDSTASTTDDLTTVTILEGLYETALKIIDKANRRLKRAGVEERFELTVVDTKVTQETTESGDPGPLKSFLVCHLSHPVIAAQGWEFIAKAEWDDDVEAILVRTNPDAEGVDHLQAPERLYCEHCNTNRARKKAYLIRHTDTGEIKTVGAQCVAPFLGLSVSALWWLDGSLDEEIATMEETGGALRASWRIGVAQALAVAWIVSDGGRAYTNSKHPKSTRNAVSDAVWGTLNETLAERRARLQLLAEAEEVAADADLIGALRSSAKTLDPMSTYGQTMQQLAETEFISAKNLGYLVSLVSVYRRAVDGQVREEKKIAERAVVAPGLYAPVGSTIADVDATVTALHGYTSTYGYSVQHGVFVTMTVATGHQLKWASTSKKAHNLEIGDRVRITTATVNRLDTFNGVDSTLLRRPTVTVIADAATEGESA